MGCTAFGVEGFGAAVGELEGLGEGDVEGFGTLALGVTGAAPGVADGVAAVASLGTCGGGALTGSRARDSGLRVAVPTAPQPIAFASALAANAFARAAFACARMRSSGETYGWRLVQQS